MSPDEPDTHVDESGIVNCGTWTTGVGTRHGPQKRHDTHSLFWITDGSAVVHMNGDVVRLVPDSVFRVPPGVEHTVDWDPHRTTRFGFIHFATDDADDLPTLRRLPPDDLVLALLNHIVWLSMERPDGWAPARVKAFDYARLAYRTGNSRIQITPSGVFSDLVARALVAVADGWVGPTMITPSLDELARKLGADPRHLCRAFERDIGVAPITAFRMVRILRAARLLIETTRSIREIALLTGFANEYHLGRVFKAKMGVPPGEYRLNPTGRTLIPPRVAEAGRYML